jgi:hypothetical protein
MPPGGGAQRDPMSCQQIPKKERHMSQEKNDANRELESAGWEPEYREGETLWRNPNDDNWYEEKQAIQILQSGGMTPE